MARPMKRARPRAMRSKMCRRPRPRPAQGLAAAAAVSSACFGRVAFDGGGAGGSGSPAGVAEYFKWQDISCVAHWYRGAIVNEKAHALGCLCDGLCNNDSISDCAW